MIVGVAKPALQDGPRFRHRQGTLFPLGTEGAHLTILSRHPVDPLNAVLEIAVELGQQFLPTDIHESFLCHT
jgi:hypothetical protein